MEKGKNVTDFTLVVIAPKTHAISRKHFNGFQMWVNVDTRRYYQSVTMQSVDLLFRSRNSFDQG